MHLPPSWVTPDGKLMIASRFFRVFGTGSVTVLMAIYLADVLKFSLPQVGLVLSAGQAGSILYVVLVGVASDFLGRRRLLVWFTLARGAVGIALAATTSFPLVLTATFLGGFTGGGGGGGPIQPLESAMLAGTASAKRRNDLYALYTISSTAGSALGSLSAGLPTLYQHLFGLDPVGSYRVTFLTYAFVNGVAALFAAFLSRAVEGSLGRAPWVNPFRLPSRGKIFGFSGLISLELLGNSLVAQSLVAYWFFTHFDIKLAALGFLFFMNSVVAASFMWLVAKVANRLGLLRTMVFIAIPSELLIALVPFAPMAWAAVSLWLVYSLTGRVTRFMRESYSMAIVQPHERVPMAMVGSLGQNTATTVGPSLATFLWSAVSASVPFVFSGGVGIVNDLALYLLFRHVKPPDEQRAGSVQGLPEPTTVEAHARDHGPGMTPSAPKEE